MGAAASAVLVACHPNFEKPQVVKAEIALDPARPAPYQSERPPLAAAAVANAAVFFHPSPSSPINGLRVWANLAQIFLQTDMLLPVFKLKNNDYSLYVTY
jgi:hypothetical protein